MSEFALRSRWILTIDGPPIEGGYVAIVDGRIAAVGPRRPDAAEVHDLGDAVLMPGLVNAHTHLEFSDLAAPLGKPGMSLPAWIRCVIAQRRRSDRDAASAIASGLHECLAAGVTTIGEIATAPVQCYGANLPSPGVIAFQEAIGFSAERVDSVLADVTRRLDATGESRGGVSPHAPYTCHPRLVERLVDLAAARRAPVAMHLAESREELELLRDGAGDFRELLQERSMWDAAAIPRGWRPLDYLKILANAPRALVIHGNYLAGDEIEFVAQHRDRMSVVFCPRTHAFFRHSPYPLAAMHLAGVRVALGTDSRASSPDLSMPRELRFVSGQFPKIDPAVILQMATLHGAEALGLDAEIGSLSPGKRADLVALRVGNGASAPLESITTAPTEVLAVWLGGELVVGDEDQFTARPGIS